MITNILCNFCHFPSFFGTNHFISSCARASSDYYQNSILNVNHNLKAKYLSVINSQCSICNQKTWPPRETMTMTLAQITVEIVHLSNLKMTNKYLNFETSSNKNIFVVLFFGWIRTWKTFKYIRFLRLWSSQRCVK